MFLIEFTIWSILAIISAVVVAQVIGIIYYSTSIGFGKKWMKEIGISDEELQSLNFKKKQGKSMVFGPLVSLVLAYGLAVMLDNLLVFTAAEALKMSAFIWLVIVVPAVGLNYLYNPHLSKKLFLIDIFYHLISIIVMSLVITLII